MYTPPTGPRKSKSRLFLFLFGAVACLLFSIVSYRLIYGVDLPRPRVEGAQIMISRLADDEKIVVEQLFEHGTFFAREYHFSHSAEGTRVEVMSMIPEWEENRTSLKLDKVLTTR